MTHVDRKIRRLRIAGWTFVGVGALTPAIVAAVVRPTGDSDTDDTVDIARGATFAIGIVLAGVGAGMLGRARRLKKNSEAQRATEIGIGVTSVSIVRHF